jgi:general secretion pathway protein M
MLQRLQQQLSLRDQAMLALLAAALLLYVLYQALWQPLAGANQRLAVQNAAATQSLANISLLAAQYRALQQGATQNNAGEGESLTQLVDASVASNGLHMSRFQPGSGGDAQVRLDNASSDAVLHWLQELEGKHGVTIRELGITPGSAPGLVNISVRLFRP